MKIAFIDVDGTLTKGLYSWEKAHHHFKKYDPDMVKKMDAHTALWEAGKIDYRQWAIMDVELWKGFPVSELDKALNPPELINNAVEAIHKLKENGFYIVLVSGGLNIMVEEVKRIVGADEAYSNKVHVKDGKLTGDIDIPVGNTKVIVIEEVLKRMNVDVENTFAVGDHVNDKEMFEHVNYSVGLNLKRNSLKDCVDLYINTEDFMDVANAFIAASK